jgi:mycofactocin precursor
MPAPVIVRARARVECEATPTEEAAMPTETLDESVDAETTTDSPAAEELVVEELLVEEISIDGMCGVY